MRTLPSLLLAALGGVVAAAPAAPLDPGGRDGIAAPAKVTTTNGTPRVDLEFDLDAAPTSATATVTRLEWRVETPLPPHPPAFRADADLRAGLLSLPPPRS